MKRLFKLAIVLLLALSMLSACNNSDPKSDDSDFVWTRDGYFQDENGYMLVVSPSQDEEYPGAWAVGFYSEQEIHGNYIYQEGRTLHGNISAGLDGEADFIVTLTEEGEDGIKLDTADGKTFHFKQYQMEEASIAVYVNTEGLGEIATGATEEEAVFNEEYPTQSSYIGLAEPATYIFDARPDEGYVFVGWKKDGEFFSTEHRIVVDLTESAEYIAVFEMTTGYEGPTDVPLEDVKTFNDILALPYSGYSTGNGHFVFAFYYQGEEYRAIANLTEKQEEELFALDWEDPEYDQKYYALLAPIAVDRIEKLSDLTPPAEDAEIVGKKLSEVLEIEDWYTSGYNLEDMEFYLTHGEFGYNAKVEVEGEIDPFTFDEYEQGDIVTITALEYAGVTNPTYVK